MTDQKEEKKDLTQAQSQSERSDQHFHFVLSPHGLAGRLLFARCCRGVPNPAGVFLDGRADIQGTRPEDPRGLTICGECLLVFSRQSVTSLKPFPLFPARLGPDRMGGGFAFAVDQNA